MSDDRQPIKRSPQLTPLSRDHHEGLLFAWKIRQGIKNETSLETINDYAKWFWSNHLDEHFREEEEILAPHMDGNEMVNRMFQEHRTIKSMIDGGLADADAVEKLAAMISDHIRFEERELFGFAEKTIPTEELNQISEELHKNKTEAANWQDEFWLKK
jgi:hemerythrin-like domain-containing protein